MIYQGHYTQIAMTIQYISTMLVHFLYTALPFVFARHVLIVQLLELAKDVQLFLTPSGVHAWKVVLGVLVEVVVGYQNLFGLA